MKKIDNFDLIPQSEIIPISISDDKMKIKCDGYYMDISLMDDEKFRIVTKYPIDKDEDMQFCERNKVKVLITNTPSRARDVLGYH